MEIELADIHTPPGNSPTSSSQRKFAKDEAVLARFGKRQQLQDPARRRPLQLGGYLVPSMVQEVPQLSSRMVDSNHMAGVCRSYDYQRWHGTLLFYAVLAFALFVNTYLGRLLPQFEPMMLLFHVMGFFGILITLVYLAPHQPAKEVFTTFLNLGGWSTTTLSFFVGLITAMNSFPGLDAADHIAEEIQNAPRVIPLSIGISTLLNGSMGFAMLIALLFCMPNNIQSVMNSETYYPFMSIYTYAVGSTSGATALVDQRTHLPLYAIGITTVINLLLALINIGSSVGFDAFISLAVASYYSSFILSASVMLNKRLTTPDSDLPWGPFRLGRAGMPVTVVAIAYSVLGAFFSMWPTAVQPSAESMNYCVVVFGGAMVFSLLFWLAYGWKHYTGPVLELRN
ncbi:MAG: hypothetical protein ASARMPRED_004307 [Alectoria sarmentosa]|nr:MAG: hypothetical protein ASARMPRED_004307 [Alectoria sarmentosa]